MKIETVALDQIQILPGRRAADPATVERIAESIGARGLLQPVGVTTDYVLIWGLHRIEAYRKRGLIEIECHVLDCDDMDRELMEIDENLAKADLAPTRRIKDTARRKELYQAKYPETKVGANNAEGGARWGKNKNPQTGDSYNRPSSFTEDTIKSTGKGRGTIERDARIGSAFAEDEIEKLAAANVPILVMDQLVAAKKRDPEAVQAVLAKEPSEMRAAAEAAAEAAQSVSTRDRLRRAQRDHPELLAKYESGELTVTQLYNEMRRLDGRPVAQRNRKKEKKAAARPRRPRELELEQLEAMIEGRMEAFLDAAYALYEIRERRLYLDTDGQFNRYLRRRWGQPFARGKGIMAALDALLLSGNREER